MHLISRPRFVLRTATLVLPAAALVWVPARVDAQADAPAAGAKESAKDDGKELVTRVYDIRDLVITINDYPFAGKMAGAAEPKAVVAGVGASAGGTSAAGGGAAAGQSGPGGPPAADGFRPTKQAVSDQLLKLFTDTIAPDSWKDNGGTVGVARMPVNGILVVTNTEEVQKQFVTMVSQLRETHATVVRVKADWLMLQPGEVDRLYKRAVDNPAGAGGDGGRAGGKPVKPASAFPEIDRDALEKAGAKNGHYRAETVCYNTQTVHVASGKARRVVSGVSSAVGTNAAAYDPTVDTVRGGLVLQVTPTLIADRPTVTLDLYSTFADVDSAAARADAGGGAGAAQLPIAAEHAIGAGTAVDRYQALSQELRTTISVPLGRPVLVGGMTLDPTSKGGDGTQLYLVIELTSSEP